MKVTSCFHSSEFKLPRAESGDGWSVPCWSLSWTSNGSMGRYRESGYFTETARCGHSYYRFEYATIS